MPAPDHSDLFVQIRRMLLAVDSQVIRLMREAVGCISLGDLAEGSWLMLTNKQVLDGLSYSPKVL